jgi:hypothetical protein
MSYNISLRDDPPVCKECEALRHDIARHVAIAAEQAEEIERLRSAISSQPVAWQLVSCRGTAETWIRMTPPIDNAQEWRPLYAHPSPNDKGQHDALLSALARATDKARHLCRLIRADSIVLDALHGNDELPAALVATESAIRISNEVLDAFLSDGNERNG